MKPGKRLAGFGLGLLTGIPLTVCLELVISKILDTAFDMCGNDIISVQPSPDGTLQAVTFERDCGATTGYSIQISILPIQARLENEAGNAFDTWEDFGQDPYPTWRGPQTHLVWINDRKIEIRYVPFEKTWYAGSVTVKKGWRAFATVDVHASPMDPGSMK